MNSDNLLPDLKIIEKFILDYECTNTTPPFKTFILYLYQKHKLNKLKYKQALNYTDNLDIVNDINIINIDCNQILFDIECKFNKIKLDLWNNDIVKNKKAYTFYEEPNTKTFIKELLDQTKEIEKLYLREYIKVNKNDFYYRTSTVAKLDFLDTVFKKLNEIYDIY